MNTECVLAALPGSSDEERLVVVHVRSAAGDSRLALRQQHWAEGIGWYDQKCLDLDPDQLADLRAVLGWGGGLVKGKGRRTGDAPATIPFPGLHRVESA